MQNKKDKMDIKKLEPSKSRAEKRKFERDDVPRAPMPPRKRRHIQWIEADPNKETPVKVIPIKKGSYAEEGYCICGACKNIVEERDKYCRHCGQKLDTGKNVSKIEKMKKEGDLIDGLLVKKNIVSETKSLKDPNIKQTVNPVPENISTSAPAPTSTAPSKPSASRYVSGFKMELDNTKSRGVQ